MTPRVQTSRNPLLTFGAPPDPAAAIALLLAALWALALALAWRRDGAVTRALDVLARRRRLALCALAAAAALLSAGYLSFYLRGGPRIIDASAYFLEARAFAEGHLAFEVPSPSASFRGRFLTHAVPSAVESPPRVALGVLFPPGYPAALALGFLVERPLWVGPFVAALLVLVTYALGRRLSGDVTSGLLAASLSVVSAALRYHTADTMSHGFAALLFACALLAALPPARALPERAPLLRALGGGACLGWLFATRPVTAVACAAACLVLLLPERRRSALAWMLGALPGLLLFFAHQRAVTGSFWTSAQLHYYALADGPPGCFGLGFGADKACLFEHGDVAERFGPGGYTLGWVLRHTLHRLHGHSLDLANFEPLWLLVPLTLLRHRATREARALGLALGATVVLYAAFYFNGSYPGGGARFFAELLPMEHALVALGAHELGKRRFVLPLALAGFALHGAFSHRALAERDGGKPLFEPHVVEEALAHRPGALVLVDSDHGFNLGHDPATLGELRSTLVARRSGDAHDFVLWRRRARPPAYRYVFVPWPGRSRLESLSLPETNPSRFEAEAEWPPLAVEAAWAMPAPARAPCASGRVLSLRPTGPDASLTIELPVLTSGPHRLRLGLASAEGRLDAYRARAGDEELVVAQATREEGLPDCTVLDFGRVQLEAPAVSFTLRTGGAAADVDFLEISPFPEPGGASSPPAELR